LITADLMLKLVRMRARFLGRRKIKVGRTGSED